MVSKVRIVIKMALKLVFFCCKIAQRLGVLPYGLYVRLNVSAAVTKFSDYTPSVTRLSCITLFSIGAKSGNFCAKKIYSL